MRSISGRVLVLILTIGVFGILNTEMGVVGLIPYVAERYGVTVSNAGFLVSGFALVSGLLFTLARLRCDGTREERSSREASDARGRGFAGACSEIDSASESHGLL